MNSLIERCWWRSLPVTNNYTVDDGGFSLSPPVLLDLLTAVHEKNAELRLKVKGASMYPAIHNGDIIRISPIQQFRPLPGDIVAYRWPESDRLVVHRIQDSRDGLFMCAGDNCENPDGWIPSRNILGLVTAIERDGKKLLLPDKKRYPFLSLLSQKLQMRINPWKNSFRRSVLTTIRSWTPEFLPSSILKFTTSGRFSLGSIIIQEQGTGDAIRKINIELHILKRCANRMEFIKLDDDLLGEFWWFTGSGTHPVFSGFGMENFTFDEAKKVFLKEGISEIWANIAPTSREVLELCTSLGFKRTSDKLRFGVLCPTVENKRIIMKASLGGY